jgi:hypothetical protein
MFEEYHDAICVSLAAHHPPLGRNGQQEAKKDQLIQMHVHISTAKKSGLHTCFFFGWQQAGIASHVPVGQQLEEHLRLLYAQVQLHSARLSQSDDDITVLLFFSTSSSDSDTRT